MKKGIHPDYHTIKVVLADGETSFETRSTWGKEGDVMQLDSDHTTHAAWNTGKTVFKKTGAMQKFTDKYGDFNIGAKKTS